MGRRRGWSDVFKALSGGNVLELLLEMLSGRRLVFRIRLRGNWRAGVTGKNVADEIVMLIHKTQRRSRLNSDRSRGRVSGTERRIEGDGRGRERGGMKRKGDFFHFRMVDCRPGLVEPTRRHFPDSGYNLFFFFRETRNTHPTRATCNLIRVALYPTNFFTTPNCRMFVVL